MIFGNTDMSEGSEKTEELKTEELGCLMYVLGLGMMIAVTMSWESNHSVLWATFDGALGWIYVIYRILIRYFGESLGFVTYTIPIGFGSWAHCIGKLPISRPRFILHATKYLP
jgi:hypothetical protein